MLKTHGIDNFVLKPVRRSYAFELAEVPRGEQWVLKVRYAASKPALPLGLSGKPADCWACCDNDPQSCLRVKM